MVDAYQRIDQVFKNESFRALMAKMMGLKPIADNAAGWTSVFWQDSLGLDVLKKLAHASEIPDVELYIDTMAKNAAEYMEVVFSYFINVIITYTLIHELTHIYTELDGSTEDEAEVDAAVTQLLRPEMKKLVKMLHPDTWMGWTWIQCPKSKTLVTWNQCVACTNEQKHPSCPLRNVRIAASPRQFEIGKYHVTELMYPRFSYFSRRSEWSMAWHEYYDMMFGTALGWYIESLHAPHESEVDLELKFHRKQHGTCKDRDETIKVVGHGDLMHLTWGIELKFYYTTRYLQKKNEPNEDHTFQIQAYWTMGKRCKPFIFDEMKNLKLIYYSKLKGKHPRRLEFDVEMKDIYELLEKNAWTLHDALVSEVPPPRNCPDWRCRFCRGSEECKSEID